MATQTRTQSGTTVIYTITDELGDAVTVTVVNSPPGAGINTSFSGSNIHQDGVQML